MRLGFHYHVPAIYHHNQIWMPAYFGLFIDSLAIRCEKIVCFFNSPVNEEIEQMDYPIKSQNVQLVNIGPHITIPLRTIRAIQMIPTLNKWQSDLDMMLMRAPTPLLPIFFWIWKKPMALLLVSDEVAGIENLPQPPWRKKLIWWWTLWNHSKQMQLSQKSLVFVNSQMLYEKYQSIIPNMILTQTTTLSENDFFYRTDTCKTPPYRLLYAGRISRTKGLFDIVKALSNLVSYGFDVVLDLVGMTDKSDPILDLLSDYSESLSVSDRICYHGYKTAGPELLSFYRNADIYVTASQSSSEGFPRTIWEAMASSTPVVATKVSSISAFAKDAALLVSPNDPEGLTLAIKEIITNPNLRKSQIIKGMALAKQNTLEKRAVELMGQIELWFHAKNEL